MGLFITVSIDEEACLGTDSCGKCLTVCPVSIFDKGQKKPSIALYNEDECTLCDLCVEACEPDCIRIEKMYES